MKILSLAGGGSSGLATAHFLEALEGELGPLRDHFDLIAGTSTGALVGAVLAQGGTARDAVNLYREELPRIFLRNPWAFWRGITGPRYSAAGLDQAVSSRFPGTLGELKVPFMACSLQVQPTLAPQVWKSWKAEHAPVPVRDALLSSTAAPWWFPPHRVQGCQPGVYLDGGLVANDPSMLAVAEGVRLSGSLGDLRVLSVRTGRDPLLTVDQAMGTQHPWSLLPRLPELFVHGTQRATEYQAHQLLGFNHHVVEIPLEEPLDQTGEDFNHSCQVAALRTCSEHLESLVSRFG